MPTTPARRPSPVNNGNKKSFWNKTLHLTIRYKHKYLLSVLIFVIIVVAVFSGWKKSGDFLKPKVIYPNMTKYLPFVYDENSYYTNQKCFIVTGQHIAFLTAFLSSSLFKFCFRDAFPELQGGTRELSKIFFDKIPVIQVTDECNETFKQMVYKLQSHFSDDLAITIDNMIFDLYNLSVTERQYIGYIEIQ